jgi:hypothetical protein
VKDGFVRERWFWRRERDSLKKVLRERKILVAAMGEGSKS